MAGLVVLTRRVGVAAWAAGASAFVTQAVGLGTAVIVAAAAPGIGPPLGLTIAALVALASIALLVWPRSAGWLAALAGRIERFPPLPVTNLAQSTALTLASWLAYGVAFSVLASGLGLSGRLPLHTATGAFALGCMLGWLALFAPGGVGVRELVFIGLLAPALGTGGAVALSLGSRVLLTVCEVAAALCVVVVTGPLKKDVRAGIAQENGRRRLSPEELKALYGEEYVRKFKTQSPRRLARLVPYLSLRPTDTVCDFGCGNGMLLDLVRDRVRHYVGVDFSEAFVGAAWERAKSLGSVDAQFVCSGIADFCASRPSSIDVAFALDFSEHLYDDEWSQILRSIRSVLKPNGRLYLHTPNADFILEMMKARNFILSRQTEHVAVRRAEENCRLLCEAGFSVNEVRVLAHYKSVLRWAHALTVLPGIGRHFGARLFIEARKSGALDVTPTARTPRTFPGALVATP
jgi:2-polyprenyl-3-methyl-5-hydroxy-6-metoxy-1,4-benzoquinol methylase